jgi:hypothetical protein
MQTICYPALREAVEMKKPLTAAHGGRPLTGMCMSKRLHLVTFHSNGTDHIKDFQYPSNEPLGMDFFKLKQAQWRDLASLFPLEYSGICEVKFLRYFVERSFGLKLRYGHRCSPLLMSIGKS